MWTARTMDFSWDISWWVSLAGLPGACLGSSWACFETVFAIWRASIASWRLSWLSWRVFGLLRLFENVDMFGPPFGGPKIGAEFNEILFNLSVQFLMASSSASEPSWDPKI